jgi:hypothetical protein
VRDLAEEFIAAADGMPTVPALGVSRAGAQLTAGLGGFKSAWAGPADEFPAAEPSNLVSHINSDGAKGNTDDALRHLPDLPDRAREEPC